jgi:hypothetical protein
MMKITLVLLFLVAFAAIETVAFTHPEAKNVPKSKRVKSAPAPAGSKGTERIVICEFGKLQITKLQKILSVKGFDVICSQSLSNQPVQPGVFMLLLKALSNEMAPHHIFF